MSSIDSFQNDFLSALESKITWTNENLMQTLHESYHLLHSCVSNILETLINRGVIDSDPYKADKKISDIKTIDESPFIDTERALKISIRLSDYESMLEYICTYYDFSINYMTVERIKKLADFNKSFQWTKFSINSKYYNTRGLAFLLAEAKKNAPAITVSLINDDIQKCGTSVISINTILKELTDLHKEIYKGNIRKSVIGNPRFNSQKAYASVKNEYEEIKSVFTAGMGKEPFYGNLIEEITQEDLSPKKDELQKKVLEKLKIQDTKKEKKEKKVDQKAFLMNAVKVLGGSYTQLNTTISKIRENHQILQDEHKSFFSKLKEMIRKAFNLKEPSVIYAISITDPATQVVQHKNINYSKFLNSLVHRAAIYEGISFTQGNGYKQVESNEESKILEFCNKQLTDCRDLTIILAGLDDFFKTAAAPLNRPRIKGMKMEISSLKNSIVKSNQYKAEYVSYLEEQDQMKKLGINL